MNLELVNAYHTVYISVGSNLGSKLENCRKGITALTCCGKCRMIDQSLVYQTEPVDYKDQDWFVNYVVKIETTLDPISLLDTLKLIERDAGRTRDAVRFGPRLLDLDIIFYDVMVVDTLKLVIPHPRMHKRRFVLKPLCDIGIKIIHPVLKKNMHYLLDSLNDNEQRIIPY